MESNNKILEKIDSMYNLIDESGKQKNKAFFSHLIKSYLPFKSVTVADVNPESKKIRVRCVFSQKELITIEGALKENTSDAFKRNFEDFISSFDVGKGCFTSTTSMKQMLNDKVLALHGKDTKTYMSQESFVTFLNWVMSKYVSGDKNIKWIVDQIAGKKFNPIITVEKKEKPVQQSAYSTPGAKTTLGDLAALQALRDKFKN